MLSLSSSFAPSTDPAVLPFPLGLKTLAFFAFASLVVSLCQRLVEQAALAVEPLERQAAFARTAVAVGSLVWALDAAGLLLYPALTGREVRLMPALLALVGMVLAARWTVPTLTSTRRPGYIALAAAGLALGMLVAHAGLMLAYGELAGQLRWSFALLSLAVATALAIALSLRHRAARLRAMAAAFRPLSWWDKLIAAGTIVVLHWTLANVMPLRADSLSPSARTEALLPVLLLAVLLIAGYQWLSLHVDAVRQRLHNRALALIRTMPASSASGIEQPLALIAERLSWLRRPEHLQLHYQPLVPQSALSTAVRFEALLRLQDPELGALSPELFLLACERAGQTDSVDRAILLRALHDSAGWRGRVPHCAGVSVNIAPDSLLKADFLPWLKTQLHVLQVPAGWLQLEMTEHALMSASAELADVLRRLRQLGVGVVMDDFGTGFSSLGVLVDLPIQGIKCDRSFVRTLEQDPDRQLLLQHLCAMAHDLRLHVSVEGVETVAALAIVRSKGADTVQGYVYAKAMPPAQVPHWLTEHVANGKRQPAALLS